jgi:hypothetical protein
MDKASAPNVNHASLIRLVALVLVLVVVLESGRAE